MENNHAMSVRIPPKMRSEIEKLAKKSRRRISDYVRLILEDAIKEQKTL